MITNWQSIVPASLVAERTGYVNLPAFSKSTTWAGASEIVGQWNYSVSGAFAITRLPEKQSGFVLCIRYTTATETFRYRLWDDDNLVLSHVPLYSGDKIAKDFTIEAWSVQGTVTPEMLSELQLNLGLRILRDDVRATDTYEAATGSEASVVATSGGDSISFPTNGLLEIWLNRLDDMDIFAPDQLLSWRSHNGGSNFLVGGIVSKLTDGVQFDDWAEELHVGASNDIDSALVSILCRVDLASGTRDNIILRSAVGVCNVDISLSYFQLFPDDGTTTPKIQLPFITGEFVIITMARSSTSNPFSTRFGYLQIYRVATEEVFDAIIPAWVDNPIRIFAVGDLINSEAPKMTIGAVARYDETYVGNNYTSSQFRALVEPITAALTSGGINLPLTFEPTN